MSPFSTYLPGFFFSFFLINLFFYWRIIALQNFAVFCQTSTWINHKYTYIPSLLKLPPISLPTPPLQVDTELLFKFPEPYSKFPLANYFTYGNVSFHVTLSLHLTLSSPLPTSLPASFLRKGPQPQNCQLYKKCTKMSLQGFKFWQQFSLVSFFGLYHTNLHKSSFTQTQPFKIPQSLRKERRSINWQVWERKPDPVLTWTC